MNAGWMGLLLFIGLGVGPVQEGQDPATPSVQKAAGTQEKNTSIQEAEYTQADPTASDPSPSAKEPALSPELAKQLGELLQRDWQNPPEWAKMASALLKREPMGPKMGWWGPSRVRYDWVWLQSRFDKNTDGTIAPDEWAGEELFFERLDRDGNGELTAEDFDWSPGSKFSRDGSVGGEMFYRLDADSNGRISMDEFADFFDRADQEKAGYLTPEDVRRALQDPKPQKPKDHEKPAAPERKPDPLKDLRMLLRGQFGTLESGPGLGELAPDFTLPKHDDGTSVTLSQLRGKKPVVLIFGSFT